MSKKFIISEKQEQRLAVLLREDAYNEPAPQNPDMKKANKPYCINPDKVLLVKKFLDKGFTPHDWEKVGANGLPMKVKIFSMNASNGEPLKWMYQDQLHDLLVDHFQNMFSDHDERDLFMKQVLKDWINGAIGVHGTLTTNFLMENTENELMGYHGSSSNFKNFDLDHSGKGHGASKYGYGIYLTFNEEDGKFYSQQAMKNNGVQNGYVYSVEIPDDNGKNYIDFESQQGVEIVKNACRHLLYSYYKNNGYDNTKATEWANDDIENSCANVGTLMQGLEISTDCGISRKNLSDYLSNQGYIGFKVPSQNYVIIFNPQNAKIAQSTNLQYDSTYTHPQFGGLNEITSNDLTAEANNADTDPSDAQKEAGNYRMGHVSVKGMRISIENPRGSYRNYKDENGNEGRNLMKHHYGYFNVTKGKDGDAVDVFLGPNIENFDKVFCVDQKKKSGEFDETKVMLGFNSKEEAKSAYLSNYAPDWDGFMSITGVSLKTFKKWLYRGRKQRQPFAEYAYIQKKKLDESILLEERTFMEVIDTLWDAESANALATRINNIGFFDTWAEVNPKNNKQVIVYKEQSDDDPWSDFSDRIERVKEMAKQFREEESPKFVERTKKVEPAYSLYEEISDFSPIDVFNNGIENDPSIDGEKANEPTFDNWKRVRKKSNHLMNLKNKETGKLLSKKWFDWIGYMINGIAIVMHDNRYNLINQQGEILLPEWHEDIWDKEDGTYELRDGDTAKTISLT